MPARLFQTPAMAEDVLREASKIGEKVTDGVKDSVRTANQQIRRGLRAAEDAIDETSHAVKRRPIAAIGIAFAVGFLIGGLTTCLSARRR